MRKEIYRMSREDSLALLERASFVHVAGTTPEGRPLLKTVNAVVCEGFLAFHGAPVGEKVEALGREVVVSAEEVVASIPSWFVDAERACPATTYYRSVQVHGALESVEDRQVKARVMAALMAKLQPEGRHLPISADHPLYRKALDGILVVGVSLERLDGKGKLGQNRSPEELGRIVDLLWRRGAPGDCAAIEAVLAANAERGLVPPSLLALCEGARIVVSPTGKDAHGAAALLDGAYWNAGMSVERIATAQRGATAWLVARDAEGAVIASARALSDGVKCAWMYDVITAPAWRHRGVGRTLVARLLDHPSLRSCANVHLHTRDRAALYRHLGFEVTCEVPRGGRSVSEMVLRRG